ncbi:MAG: metallophosphoesterase [Azonexus sp.]
MKAWLAALLLAVSAAAPAETYHFALIGDVPYSAHERRELPKMLNAIADSQVDLVAHIGDIKPGKERCDDSLFADRYQLFNASRIPFVFVPGDNEWTDCDRRSNGAYDPLERLDKLRSLFWKDAYSLGQKKLKLEQQVGTYPEHARFQLGPVLFVTLNIPGGNNFGMNNEPTPEFLARQPVVLDWLKDSFALARHKKLAGIVLLFQADPAFKHFANGFGHRAFQEFLDTLRAETLNFPGQVVAVHGDSHISRIDQPLRDTKGKTISNFARVETFGYPIMGWTHATIDTDSPTLFRFEAHAWPPRQP